MAEIIGNQIGRFRHVDLDSGGQFWGASLRVRVGLNVTKPLRRILKLHTILGSELIISFSYERLPNFCYWCGYLGHIMKLCERQYESDFNEKQEPLPFGPWLRATTPAILRSRGTSQCVSRPCFATHYQPSSSTNRDTPRRPAIFNYSPTPPKKSLPLIPNQTQTLSTTPNISSTIQNPIPNSLNTATTTIHPTTLTPCPENPVILSAITPSPVTFPCAPPTLNLTDVPLTFAANPSPAPSLSQSSSTTLRRGRKKGGIRPPFFQYAYFSTTKMESD
ncbi:UNVERIFIED_CONTAM: hypothetical protein Sradi_2963600 [Sesamum radiatum]|uniref:Zinc knuckle CX2CX4HX4C domain-containing protein n=1 Tax=Sesamum radiatum TaxID=300843 RepID=A0AAW2RZN0_SESRA